MVPVCANCLNEFESPSPERILCPRCRKKSVRREKIETYTIGPILLFFAVIGFFLGYGGVLGSSQLLLILSYAFLIIGLLHLIFGIISLKKTEMLEKREYSHE